MKSGVSPIILRNKWSLKQIFRYGYFLFFFCYNAKLRNKNNKKEKDKENQNYSLEKKVSLASILKRLNIHLKENCEERNRYPKRHLNWPWSSHIGFPHVECGKQRHFFALLSHLYLESKPRRKFWNTGLSYLHTRSFNL